MVDKPEITPFRGMTPAEEAEYHRANAERYAEHMESAAPVQLDRVVSTRFAAEELQEVKEFATEAGISVSELIRRATVAYITAATEETVTAEPSVPAHAVLQLLHDYGVEVNEVELRQQRRLRRRLSDLRRWAEEQHVSLHVLDDEVVSAWSATNEETADT
ncbi:plasmid mobilization protein [Actinomadura kijaniata]|uniref:plasmid mobilization protein n=1 Tax=Actinomadura kijaniata TaxID=46161 RepID=UPI003F1E067C